MRKYYFGSEWTTEEADAVQELRPGIVKYLSPGQLHAWATGEIENLRRDEKTGIITCRLTKVDRD